MVTVRLPHHLCPYMGEPEESMPFFHLPPRYNELWWRRWWKSWKWIIKWLSFCTAINLSLNTREKRVWGEVELHRLQTRSSQKGQIFIRTHKKSALTKRIGHFNYLFSKKYYWLENKWPSINSGYRIVWSALLCDYKSWITSTLNYFLLKKRRSNAVREVQSMFWKITLLPISFQTSRKIAHIQRRKGSFVQPRRSKCPRSVPWLRS